MKTSRPRPGYPRALLLAVALVLPAMSLIPLGSIWLWQQGYVVHWAIATALAVAGIYWLERRLLVPLPPASDLVADPGRTIWTPRQTEAWEDVLRLADDVKPERIASRDTALDLAKETIEVVARRLHPERTDPLLQFTVPEALAVIEGASANMRNFVVTSLPLGDRITVAQLMWVYRWRGALSAAEKGYELWRLLRMLNPASAVTQELRERFSRQLYEIGREQLAGRLARAFVSEVGRAAIDLYGGSLRVSGERLRTHVTTTSARDLEDATRREAEPVRILVAGQTGAGKSSLINALAGAVAAAVDVLPTTSAFTAYRLSNEKLPTALIIDSPGLTGAGDIEPLIEAANDCDLVLWACAATRAARDIDSRALASIRAHFAAEVRRSPPPMLLVLTHIDRLRPFSEWSPPYDLAAGTGAKLQSIRDAMQAVGEELGFSVGEIVPVRSDAGGPPYNLEQVWAKIIDLMPDANRARLLRTLEDIASTSAWRTVWSQAAGAGRALKGALLGRDTRP